MSPSDVSSFFRATGCLLSVLLIATALAGCRRDRQALVGEPIESRFGRAGVDHATGTAYPLGDVAIHLSETDEDLWVFDGKTGEPVTGRRLLERLRAADVVILGETHDDPMAHVLQERFVREALATGDGALSLEMMTRDDQATLNRLRGRPGGAEELLADSSLARWDRWHAFYLPSIEAALAMGRPVVAANPPAEYVRMARMQGFDALEDLEPQRRRLFDVPEEPDSFPDYRRRFGQTMSGHGDVSPATQPATTRSGRERLSAHAPPDAAQTRPSRGTTRPTTRQAQRPPRDPASIDAFFDAQLLWDATMAQSILSARARHGGPVVHLVGSFHSDFDGGLTTMLERKGQDVLTVSFVPVESQRLAPEDVGRADIVIYTGSGRPLPPEWVPATRPATRPAPPPVLGKTPPVVGRGAAAPATVPATRPTTRRSDGGQ